MKMKLIYSNFTDPCNRNWKTFILDWWKMHWPGVPLLILTYCFMSLMMDFLEYYGCLEIATSSSAFVAFVTPLVVSSLGLGIYILIGVPYNTVCLAIAYKRGKLAKRYF